MINSSVITTENSNIELDQNSLFEEKEEEKRAVINTNNNELNEFLLELSSIKMNKDFPISNNKDIFFKVYNINNEINEINEIKCFGTPIKITIKLDYFSIKILLSLKSAINLEKSLTEIFNKEKDDTNLEISFNEDNVLYNKILSVSSLKKIKISNNINGYAIKIIFLKK